MCADISRQFAPDSHPNRAHAIPTPAELRKACYAIMRLAQAERDAQVKRILAADAFALAQRAQLQSSAGDTAKTRTG